MAPQGEADPRLDAIRTRIFAGLEEAVERGPFHELTVGDIVADAGMSKRAFYEVYPHKNACLVDHYERHVHATMRDVERRVAAADDRLVGVSAALEGVFEPYADRPGLARAHLFDLYASGLDGARARLEADAEFARLLQSLAGLDQLEPGLTIPIDIATSVIGGINDIAVRAVLDNGLSDVRPAIEAATQLIRAVMIGLYVDHRWGPIDLPEPNVASGIS